MSQSPDHGQADMFRERRSKQNHERHQIELRRQRDLGAQQGIPAPTPSPSRSASTSIDWSNQGSSTPANSGNPSHSSSDYSPSPSPSDAGSQSLEYVSTEGSDSSHARLSARLSQRKYENTRRVDFDTLEALGVCEEFLRLTGRIGFTPAFWNIARDCYNELTHEFISSLKVRRDSHDRAYIKFMMRGEKRVVSIDRLREWFGFQPNPNTTSLEFRVGFDKEQFWHLISGMEHATSNQYRSTVIAHPFLRCIQRALSTTIFARGETVARVNEEDLWLMDHMLRPEAQLERPDLMLYMALHWADVQKNKKIGGSIHIGAYVTLIADKLGVPTTGFHLSKGNILMDAKAYERATFLRIEKGPANHRDRYFWRLAAGPAVQMPIDAPISVDDETSWFYSGPPPAAQAPPSPLAQPHHDEPHHDDIHMADASISPPPFHPSTFAAGPSTFTAGPSTSYDGPSYPPPIADPTIQDVYRLVYDMRREHGAILHDLRRRIGDIEDEMRDWRFDPSDD